MNRLTLTDFYALSPLLILLVGGLLLLLIESFWEKISKKIAYPVALLTIALALYANLTAPVSTNPLLTDWFKFDALGQNFTTLFMIIGLASTVLASTFFKRYAVSHGEYFFFLIAALFGLVLIGSSADFLTLFLGVETLSLALYVLCGYMKSWEHSNESSMKYFFMGSLAAAFLLYGIALVYGATGTTQLSGLLPSYMTLGDSEKVLFLGGIALITVSLLFEAAVVPFHYWAPDVYQGAPTPIVAFMATGTKVGAFAGLTRVFLEALPQFNLQWNEMVSWLAIATMIVANLAALKQTQLNRFFAYSGIAHAGLLLLPLVAATPDSYSALMFYLWVYVIATLAAFTAVSFISEGRAKDSFKSASIISDPQVGSTFMDLKGLFYKSPFLASLLTLALLTLAGVPPTVGFFAKFYLFKNAYQAGYLVLVIVGLIASVISLFYYLRLIGLMLTTQDEEASRTQKGYQRGLDLLQSKSGVTLGCALFAALVLLLIYPDWFIWGTNGFNS